MQDPVIACSLDGAALARRQRELASGLFAEALGVDRLADGYRWTFPSADGLLARLAAVVEAERHCCRFLRFALHAEPDNGVVALEVSGPPGTHEFLERWLGEAPDVQ
jgi:hypothetical protein